VDNLPPGQRSTLVTGVAWTFIVLGGFAAFVCLMQIIMIAVIFPHGVMPRVASQGDALVGEFARLIFNHIQMIFLSLLLVFATTFAAAAGLLKRENWARMVFIGLMGLGIAWNVASIILVYYFLPSMSEADLPPALQAQFNIMRDIAVVFSLAMFCGFVGLFGWIVRRLRSDEVRREFSKLLPAFSIYLGKALVASALASSTFGGVCFAQNSAGELRISQNAAHEVTATVTGEVARCGLTAIADEPTFRLSGQVVDVVQPVVGIACRADVPQGALRPYHVTINLGHLPPGDYIVNWTFPKLTATYKVSP